MKRIRASSREYAGTKVGYRLSGGLGSRILAWLADYPESRHRSNHSTSVREGQPTQKSWRLRRIEQTRREAEEEAGKRYRRGCWKGEGRGGGAGTHNWVYWDSVVCG